ncbi:MAG: hypothetical protein WHS46_08955 [Desulfosoma sp.]
MKLFRFVTTLLLVAVMVLFVRQNMATFQRDLDFMLYLFIREDVRWTLKVFMVIFISGFVGLLVGLFLMFRPFLRTRRALQAERAEKERLLAERARAVEEVRVRGQTEQESQAPTFSESEPHSEASA